MFRVLLIGTLIACVSMGFAQDAHPLDNGKIAVELKMGSDGTPMLGAVRWKDTCAPGYVATKESPLSEWIPLERADAAATVWANVCDPVFQRAEAGLLLENGLRMTWVAELAPDAAWLRLHVRIANSGTEPRAVASFPIWRLTGDFPGANERLHYWDSLSFERKEHRLSGGKPVTLGSRLHSSDTLPEGWNPWWVFAGPEARTYFGLAWCGGWRAELGWEKTGGFVRAVLPPEETQLTLAPGETVDGPVLSLMFARGNSERETRREWLLARADIGEKCYPGPAPAFPFTYNNWYTTRFDFDSAFLRGQQRELAPYAFDYFIVDAGWYEACGKWTPAPAKFGPGEFEGILKDVQDSGVKIGIWSCPQFVKADKAALPPEVDSPGFYRDFIDGWLLDYAGMDFTKFMLEHVAGLRANYFMDWWKYDQDFFTESTRHGAMKNVVALQHALEAVRRAQPDLVIEDCQSGGRMLNDFTAMLAQNHWIRDGGRTGIEHARSNLRETLGALDILPPWGVNRWLNNPDRNDPEDDEFMRMYCRASMCGTWGLVADLRKVPPRQREVIVRETANYRRLNKLKAACRYDIIPFEEKADAAGIVYYDAEGARAGMVLVRWDARKAFSFKVRLEGLSAEGTYSVTDVDAGMERTMDGAALVKNGMEILFPKERKSAMVFVER